jgi:hypothetical protein
VSQRLDADADARGARIGKSERARPDVHHDLAVEEVGVLDPRLLEDAADRCSCLLPAAPLIGRSRFLPRKEFQDVAGDVVVTCQGRTPALQPPGKLFVAVDLGRRAESLSQA